MTITSETTSIAKLADRVEAGRKVDAIDEWRAFSEWWKRTIQTDVPSPTSYYFDTWMASRRRALSKKDNSNG